MTAQISAQNPVFSVKMNNLRSDSLEKTPAATKTKQHKKDLEGLVLQMAVEMSWGDQNLLNASGRMIYLRHPFFFPYS